MFQRPLKWLSFAEFALIYRHKPENYGRKYIKGEKQPLETALL